MDKNFYIIREDGEERKPSPLMTKENAEALAKSMEKLTKFHYKVVEVINQKKEEKEK